MLQRLLKTSRAYIGHAGISAHVNLHASSVKATAQTLQGGVGLLDVHKAATSASRGNKFLSHNLFNSQQGWLKQHRLQQAALYSTDAGPIKSKGMTAGTLPPAADQVPSDNSTAPVKEQAAATVQQTLAAAAERARPASRSGPPGLDQVPASAQPGPSNQESQPADPTVGSDTGAHAAAAPAADQQSAAQDSSQPQQYQAEGNNSNSARQQIAASGWQRFKWLLWGTPPEYWKHGKASSEAQHLSAGSSSSSDSSGTASTASGTAAITDSQDVKKSRFSLAGIIERAILRTRVVRDEDVARFASKSAAIAVYTLAGFSVLGTLGVDTKPLVAGLGVGGFTVGFALRDVATNFVSGVLLVLQRPFEKGDKVRVHAGSTALEGIIHSIDLRYIIIKATDNTTVMIPASIVYANPVVVYKK